jgi:hypothetical protein
MNDDPVTNASELGEWSFCRRAWWLRHVCGLRSTALQALAQGRALHENHGRRASQAVSLERLARLVFVIAVALLLVGGAWLVWIGGRS